MHKFSFHEGVRGELSCFPLISLTYFGFFLFLFLVSLWCIPHSSLSNIRLDWQECSPECFFEKKFLLGLWVKEYLILYLGMVEISVRVK